MTWVVVPVRQPGGTRTIILCHSRLNPPRQGLRIWPQTTVGYKKDSSHSLSITRDARHGTQRRAQVNIWTKEAMNRSLDQAFVLFNFVLCFFKLRLLDVLSSQYLLTSIKPPSDRDRGSSHTGRKSQQILFQGTLRCNEWLLFWTVLRIRNVYPRSRGQHGTG